VSDVFVMALAQLAAFGVKTGVRCHSRALFVLCIAMGAATLVDAGAAVVGVIAPAVAAARVLHLLSLLLTALCPRC
jgi:hypothetical protein